MDVTEQTGSRTLEEARAGQEPAENPYLSGIHRPMTEELTLEQLPVTGTLPAELNGRYVRIGPNPVNADPDRHHWFVGDGMVHGLAIENGRAVWYRNRWIRSNAVAQALGEMPAPGPRHPRMDTVNTNVIDLAGGTWALVEAGSTPVALSDDLERQAYDAFSGTLAGSFSAHPHKDEATGNLHAIAYEGGVLDRVTHVVVSPEGRVVREEPITVRHGPSIHDCAVTERFVVVLDLPVTFSLDAALRGRAFPFRWNGEHPARVGLMPKDGRDADIVWCEVEPCYAFHTGNAWEAEDGSVVLDVVAYQSMFDGDQPGPGGRCLGLERWTIDPHARRVGRRVLDPLPQEFPRYDERRTGRPYRYLYTVAFDEGGVALATRIHKHDLERGSREDHDFGANRVPGEFVFVPAPGAAGEDEGWLVGLVVDAAAETTELVVLHAQSFVGPPVAAIRLPHRVPPGFHGNWIATRPEKKAVLF